MVFILCFMLIFAQAAIYMPKVYGAPIFTISPASCSAALLPARVTVGSSEASFTADSATPYIIKDGSVVKTVTITNITSTANQVSFTIGSGLVNGIYGIRIVDPKGVYNVGNFVIGDPSVTAISPSSLAKGFDQQTSITLTADKTNFVLGQTTVEILDGSGKAVNYVGGVTSVASSTQLTFTVKPGLPSGTYSVRAVTGNESATGENKLTVRGTPTIALSSNQLLQGYATTAMSITGTNTGFTSETTVRILDSADQATGKAGQPTITNANTLSFSVNSGLTPGSYKVKVKTGIEEATATLTVLSAAGELLSQSAAFKGTPAGYTADKNLVFKGTNTNFAQGTSQLALFAGSTDKTSAYISNVTVNDVNTISFTLAKGLAAGSYTVKVITGTQIVSADFTVNEPTVSETTFNSNIVSGTNIPKGYKEFKINMVGTNTLFQAATTVEIQDQVGKTKTINVSDNTHLSFYLIEGLDVGNYTIKVDADGNAATTQDCVTKSFTVTQPGIQSITPNTIISAPGAPSTTITVMGQNTHFTAGTPSIDILNNQGESISNIIVTSDTQLTFKVTPDSVSAGAHGISVHTLGSGVIDETAEKADMLTVQNSGISSISPNLVYTDELGTKSIALTGLNTGFNSNTNVYIDEKTIAKKVAAVTVTSATRLSFTVPAGLAVGAHTIFVEQGLTTYETSFVVAARTITLSSTTKVFGYSPFDMTVTASGITFDSATHKPNVTITGPGGYSQTITLDNADILQNTITFPFPTGRPFGTYTVTLSWSSGDYSGISLQSTFNITHQISGLYIKKGEQTVTAITAAENAPDFNLKAYAVMVAGGDDQDKTLAAAWSIAEGNDVISLDANVVHVLKYGKAKVKATYDGQEATLDITVTPAVSSIAVTPTTISLSEGDTSDMVAVTATMTDGSKQAVQADDWQVTARTRHDGTNGPVVSITTNENGAFIKGEAAGTAKVTATYSGKTAVIDVTVIGIDKIIINAEAQVALEIGQQLNLTASAVKTDGSNISITNSAQWASSNTDAATVANGIVTPKAKGVTDISIGYMGETAKITVTVVAIESIQITGGDTVKVGETIPLQLNAVKSDNTNRDITALAVWISSDETKATVTNGEVAGIAVGTVTITANYEGKTTTKIINIASNVPALTSITFGAAASSMIVNNSVKVTAIAKYENNTQQDITKDASLQIADPTVLSRVTLNGDSYLKGLKVGTTTVYVTYNNKQSNTLTFEVKSISDNPPPPPIIVSLPVDDTYKPPTQPDKITTTNNADGSTDTVVPKAALDDAIAKLPKDAGKLELDIAKSGASDQSITLDSGSLKELGDKNLSIIIKTEKLNMELPPGFINSSDKLKVDIKTLSSSEASAIENKISKDKASDLGRLGGIVEFNASLINDKNAETNISGFTKKVKITMNIEGIDMTKQNPELLAIYVYDPTTSTWKYVGGTVSADKKTITFETPHFSAYALMLYKKEFVDTKGHWAKDYINVIASKQITTGTDATHFDPAGKVTRGQFAAFIVRALGLELGSYQGTFKDVAKDFWYTPYVEAAAKAGIVTGYDGKYSPDAQITREQMATMIMRAYAYKTGKSIDQIAAVTGVNLGDMSDVSGYALNAVKAAYGKDIMKGNANSMFKPKDFATRAEVAKIIVKLLEVAGTGQCKNLPVCSKARS